MENLSQTPIKGNSQVLDQAHLLISIERKVHQLIEAELCENLDVSLSDAARNGTLIELINAVCPGKHVEYKKKPTAHFAKVDNIRYLQVDIYNEQYCSNPTDEDINRAICIIQTAQNARQLQKKGPIILVLDDYDDIQQQPNQDPDSQFQTPSSINSYNSGQSISSQSSVQSNKSCQSVQINDSSQICSNNQNQIYTYPDKLDYLSDNTGKMHKRKENIINTFNNKVITDENLAIFFSGVASAVLFMTMIL